jgi:hypothetical protein
MEVPKFTKVPKSTPVEEVVFEILKEYEKALLASGVDAEKAHSLGEEAILNHGMCDKCMDQASE